MEQVLFLLVTLAGVTHGKTLIVKETNVNILQDYLNNVWIRWVIFADVFWMCSFLAFLPAAETKCDATSNTSVLCQVHLGGTVYIQMMNNASRHQLRCKKYLPTGTISVFSLKKEKVTIEEPFRNKTTEFFINNGTLKITNVEKNHSGRYNLEVFDPRGIQVKNIDINLDVQGKCLKLNLISQHIIKCNQEKYKYPIHEEKNILLWHQSVLCNLFRLFIETH